MNPDQMRDASLLELFQMEAQAQAEVLNAGLVAIERDPTSATDLEACMRATHSLKGAARIVDLDMGVKIAHVMEDCLVDAQAGKLTLTPAHVDVLLQGVDLLLKLADPQYHADITPDAAEVYTQKLAMALAGVPAPPPAAPPPALPELPFEPVAAPVAAPAAPPPEPARQPAVPPAPNRIDDDEFDRPLRVSAGTLDRLVALAGETLVEANWLRPFNTSMLRVRRTQQNAVRALEQLRTLMAERETDGRLDSALEDVRKLMEQCQQSMGERLNELDRFGSRVEQLSTRLYDAALASRMRPFGDALPGAARMVRDLARTLGKQVKLEILGATTQVDRDILEALDAPLTHMLRNAVDHGIESPAEREAAGKSAEGLLRVHAMHRAGRLVIEVTDDGSGIDLPSLRARIQQRGYASADTAERMSDAELLSFLFLPGFSTRSAVTELSGRGVGLDVVQDLMRQLHGVAHMEQQTGQGTRVVMEMPLSLSVVRSLLVEVGGEVYGFPLGRVERTLKIAAEEISSLEGQQHFLLDDRHVSLVAGHQLLQYGEATAPTSEVAVVVIGSEQGMYGIAVDRLLGERSLAIQPLDPRLGKVQDIHAGALLDDGTPVLMLDVEDMKRSIEKLASGRRLARVDAGAQAAAMQSRKHVLVVDDSLTVRELERKLLHNRGYEVSVAVDGMEAWNMLQAGSFDLLVTDVDMPRMDGIELVTRVRADARLSALPAMVVSYKDRESDRQRGLDAGADYYLAKGSFHDDTLLDAVVDLIGEARP